MKDSVFFCREPAGLHNIQRLREKCAYERKNKYTNASDYLIQAKKCNH